ncbi:hypothetical protein ACVWW2_005397 [Bradyrhizobium sp. LM4.3]
MASLGFGKGGCCGCCCCCAGRCGSGEACGAGDGDGDGDGAACCLAADFVAAAGLSLSLSVKSSFGSLKSGIGSGGFCLSSSLAFSALASSCFTCSGVTMLTETDSGGLA